MVTKQDGNKGISSIVAVVILIGIAIIASVSVYFWMGGMTTKQPTPNPPVSIVANPVGPGKVLIANLGPKPFNTSSLKASSGSINCPARELAPGEQVLCTVNGSGTIAIWGNGTGSTTLNLPKENDNPPVIEEVWDNSTNREMLLGEDLGVWANVTDDYQVAQVILNITHPNGTYAEVEMNHTDGVTYEASVKVKSAGTLTYHVKAKDTGNQWTTSETRDIAVIDNWMKEYGTYFSVWRVIKTRDGGFLSAGRNNDKAFVSKFDPDLSLNWTKTKFPAGNGFHSICQDHNGSYLAAGDNIFTKFTPKTVDWIIRYTRKGSNMGSGPITEFEDGYLVGLTDGSAYPYLVLMKIDKNGNVKWAIKGGYFESHSRKFVKENGTVFVLGSYSSSGRPIILKLENGTVEWGKPIYFTNQKRLHIFDIYNDTDGYVLAGTGTFNNDTWGGVLLKFDKNWNPVWGRMYPKLYFMSSNSMSAESIQRTPDGGYIIPGYTYGNLAPFGNYDGLLLKVNSTGDVEWAKVYGGNSSDFLAYAEENNGLIAFGTSNLHMLAIKADDYGNLYNCSHYQDITANVTEINLTPKISYYNTTWEDITDQINITYMDTSAIRDIIQAETCICQPFGC